MYAAMHGVRGDRASRRTRSSVPSLGSVLGSSFGGCGFQRGHGVGRGYTSLSLLLSLNGYYPCLLVRETVLKYIILFRFSD